jgi:hypothetical protein
MINMLNEADQTLLVLVAAQTCGVAKSASLRFLMADG